MKRIVENDPIKVIALVFVRTLEPSTTLKCSKPATHSFSVKKSPFYYV
jgi:hypothetical protein